MPATKKCAKGKRLSKDPAKKKKGVCVKKRKAPAHPAMKARSALVKRAFAAVRAANTAGRKVDAPKVMANPQGAIANPTAYYKR